MGLLENLLGEKAKGSGRTWVPSKPESVFRNEPLNSLDEFDPKEGEKTPWHEAPPGSHLERFRYIDTRKDSVARRFIGKSYIEVVFREKVTKNKTYPRAVYAYYFSDPQEGLEVFRDMQETEHPGEILYARVEEPGVPYERKA